MAFVRGMAAVGAATTALGDVKFLVATASRMNCAISSSVTESLSNPYVSIYFLFIGMANLLYYVL